jgi:hypothetical protein
LGVFLREREQPLNIPKWFDVANYDCVKTWTAREWTHAVFTRNLVSSTLHVSEHSANFIEPLIDAFGLDRTATKAGTLETWDALMRKMHQEPEGIKDRSFYDFQAQVVGVMPVSLGDLGLMYAEATSGMSQNELDYLAGHSESAQTEEFVGLSKTVIRDPGIESWDGSYRVDATLLASVDLAMPDEILIKQFAELIRESREKYGVEQLARYPSESDFRRWHEAMILAYFDLLLLGQINAITLTNEQIGTCIFPKEFNVSLADRIRKVTKPLSTAVFRGATFMALDLAQASGR